VRTSIRSLRRRCVAVAMYGHCTAIGAALQGQCEAALATLTAETVATHSVRRPSSGREHGHRRPTWPCGAIVRPQAWPATAALSAAWTGRALPARSDRSPTTSPGQRLLARNASRTSGTSGS
jgi:hypothetical protein